MKNIFSKTIRTAALTLLLLAGGSYVPASAQEMNTEEANSSKNTRAFAAADAGRGDRLEGAWNIQVTRRNCQTGEALISFPTMSIFMQGGTMQDTGVALMPSGRGPGHGVWSFEGDRQYANAFQFFLFAADGTYAGRQVIRRQIELDREDEYAGVGDVKVYNPAGALVATICTTETGTRFR